MHIVYTFSSVHLVHSRWVTSGVPTLHSSLSSKTQPENSKQHFSISKAHTIYFKAV